MKRIELSDEITGSARTLWKIQTALEAAGVEFIPADDEKGPGLRLKHKAASAGYSRRKLLDRMIAAQALVHRATLVSFNPDDFSDVPGLSSLVWPST